MAREKFSTRLTSGGFVRQQLAALEKVELMDSFAGQGYITDVCGIIDDGKEATVYLCRADPSVGVDWLAGKVYRPTRFRAFSGSGRYAGHRTHMDGRGSRAIEKRTRRGKQLAQREWVAWEWETLGRLSDAGADVPEPLAVSGDAILMEYLGDADGAAPQLRLVRLDVDQAKREFARLMRNVEILLDNHLVHGDLSAYNVLWWKNRTWVIDVPQAVDARTNRDAERLLARDIGNVERYFRPYGIGADGLARRLWARHRRGELGR